MGLFGLSKKERNAPSLPIISTGNKLVKEDFYVAGVYYHEDSINKLRIPTEDWRKSGKTLAAEGKFGCKVFHYTYVNKPVKVEHEAGNEYDINAMKVIVAGEHVGYIPEDQAAHVRAIISTASVKYITASISGGEYKVVSTKGEAIKVDGSVSIKIRIAYSAP